MVNVLWCRASLQITHGLNKAAFNNLSIFCFYKYGHLRHSSFVMCLLGFEIRVDLLSYIRTYLLASELSISLRILIHPPAAHCSETEPVVHGLCFLLIFHKKTYMTCILSRWFMHIWCQSEYCQQLSHFCLCVHIAWQCLININAWENELHGLFLCEVILQNCFSSFTHLLEPNFAVATWQRNEFVCSTKGTTRTKLGNSVLHSFQIRAVQAGRLRLRFFIATRMHSSRMRTAHLPTIKCLGGHH